MAATAELLQTYETPFNQQERLKNDVQTLMAEMLNGSMRSQFEYYFDGQDLYSQDGGAMGMVFTESLRAAQDLAEQNPILAFEARRRQHEMVEYQDMLAMADKKLPNTMVVVSDFPPELMHATKDVGGYNVTRKQTMLRVITRKGDGTLSMVSQSLDKSDRRALETLYHELGFVPKPGELLGQRMHIDMPVNTQERMVDHLVHVYDSSLQAQHGGNWQAGRPNTFGKNTYDFVRAQGDLLKATIIGAEHINDISETNLYNLAAALERRYEGRVPHHYVTYEQVVMGHPMMLPTHELNLAGQEARAAGRGYSGCGITLKGSGAGGVGQEMSELGYGNQSGEEDGGPDGLGPLKFKCKYGHWNERPKGKLITECQTRGCKKGSVGC